FPRVDGVGFVGYAGELVGMSRKDALQRAHEVLDYVGLGEARYRTVETYSTGMKQRLKLAAAIVHDPQLLILDEPTNGMDPAGRGCATSRSSSSCRRALHRRCFGNWPATSSSKFAISGRSAARWKKFS